MKTLLLIACAGALMTAGVALSRADDLPALSKFAAAGACEADCHTNANACREQCANPEEPEQCIVACSRSECNASCDKFEEACKKRCANTPG